MRNKGFILIELIIYIGLFSLIMGSLAVSVYQLTSSAENSSARADTQAELNFILNKIDWFFSAMENIESPLSGESRTLRLKKYGSANVWALRLNDNDIVEICVDLPTCASSSNFYPLSHTPAEDMSFEYIAPTQNAPAGIKTTLVFGNMPIIFNKYLRN